MLNLFSVLARPYTITYQDDHLVKNIEDVKVGNQLQVRMQNGIITTNVLDKKGL